MAVNKLIYVVEAEENSKTFGWEPVKRHGCHLKTGRRMKNGHSYLF
jgi:hypothetical protein